MRAELCFYMSGSVKFTAVKPDTVCLRKGYVGALTGHQQGIEWVLHEVSHEGIMHGVLV